jgi:plasmid stabilization system protein ParE
MKSITITWSDFALQSLEEIIIWYEIEAGRKVADSIEGRIFKSIEELKIFPTGIPVSEIFPDTRKLVIKNLPYVAFIRQLSDELVEVVDIVHTSRKLPKNIDF